VKVPEHQSWWLAAEGQERLADLLAVAKDARASGLSCLSRPGDPIVDDHVESIPDQLPDLRVLSLPGSRLTSRGIARVARLRRLQRLDLSYAEGPEPREDPCFELGPLRDLTELLVLDPSSVVKAKSDLECLPSSLRRLSGVRGPVERLARFVELTHLDLRGSSARATALRALAPLRQLRVLGLHGTRVDDAALASLLPHMPALESLDLERCDGVSDEGLRCIATHARELRSLNLDYSRSTTPDGLLSLRHLTKLETLYLRAGKSLLAAQAPARKALREALPGCRVLPDT
jgi:hypothetical protein